MLIALLMEGIRSNGLAKLVFIVGFMGIMLLTACVGVWTGEIPTTRAPDTGETK